MFAHNRSIGHVSGAMTGLLWLYQSACAAPIPGQGTWETSLSARDVNGDGTPDAWYDITNDLTWLASAQELTYAQGASFIAGLDLFGVTGWDWANLGQVSGMYYSTLGNMSNPPGQRGWRNTGPFSGLEDGGVGSYSGWFWTGAPLVPVGAQFPNVFTSQVFAADGTGVFIYNQASTEHHNVWAVRTGDISIAPVPEAETWALMLVGLGGIAAAARRRGQGRVAEVACKPPAA